MSTRGSGSGPERVLDLPRSSEASEGRPGLTRMRCFEKIRLLDPVQVREQQADRLKQHVPLRRKAYSKLLSVFNTAQQKGHTLRQVLDDLNTRAETDPEAALLLRDLWEVSNITESAIAQHHRPDKDAEALMKAAKQLLARPFGGEEVLF